MIEKLVPGFVIVGLMIMVTLAYAQKHEDACTGTRSKPSSPAVHLATTYRSNFTH